MKTEPRKTKRAVVVLFFLLAGMEVKAQFVISDPMNTVQSTLTAGNTAAAVMQAVEQVNKLQTTLDYVQKVSATIRRAQMFEDLIGRQNRLNGNCLRTLEEAKALKLENMGAITSSIQGVVSNNAAIISLTADILASDLKMNDSQRMKHLKKCLAKVREQESELATIRQIVLHAQTIKRNLGLITE